ncbi:MAG: hypothetical protein QG560_250 [Campylobacterota bacterium]|nr:hypothetical protein [Campylobacterota bacterium]
MVDTADSKSANASCGGSSPPAGTTIDFSYPSNSIAFVPIKNYSIYSGIKLLIF